MVWMTIFPDGMGSCGILTHLRRDPAGSQPIWDGIEKYFCPIKKFRTGVRYFFFTLAYTGREWNWQISSYPSYCRLRMRIFSIGMGSCEIPSLLGRYQDIFLSKKKYRDDSGTFFHPTCIYRTRLRLVNLIPSRPIANPNSWIGGN